MAVTSSASITGMPENNINVETKKWKPTGVAKNSPPMWYLFISGKAPFSKIWLMILPWKPISELGGYWLWKITAALKVKAKQKIANSSKNPLCFVTFTSVANDYTFYLNTIYCFPTNKLLKKETRVKKSASFSCSSCWILRKLFLYFLKWLFLDVPSVSWLLSCCSFELQRNENTGNNYLHSFLPLWKIFIEAAGKTYHLLRYWTKIKV